MTTTVSSAIVLCLSSCTAACLEPRRQRAGGRCRHARRPRRGASTLLKEGADVNAPQGDGMTALHWAAERGDAELTNMLIYGGANVARGHAHRSVHAAAYRRPHRQRRRRQGAARRQGRRERARRQQAARRRFTWRQQLATSTSSTRSLDAKADINAKEPEWDQTPLIFAAAAESRRRGQGAAQARRGRRTRRPRRLTSARSRSSIARRVSCSTKILEATVPKGQKATASQVQASIQAARELLRSGKVPPPDPNAARPAQESATSIPRKSTRRSNFKGGMTALHHAVRQGYVETARALIEGGADINKPMAGDGSYAAPRGHHQRPVRRGHAADRKGRRSEPRR